MTHKKMIKTFLSLSILSSVGNSCANWALFFYALDKVGFGSQSGLSTASLFYIGLGIGKMILAPCLGTFFDKFPKKKMSILIDGSYALLLIVTALLFYQGLLNDTLFLVITILVHAFSQVHVQSIGFSAIKKHAPKEGGRHLALMFALSNGAGIAVSGITFSLVGFYGSMAIGVLTFIPIIFFYPLLFDDNEKAPSSQREMGLFPTLADSFKFLVKDKVLIKIALVVGVSNVVAALFPAFLKLQINKTFLDNDYLTAPILAGGLFLIALFYKKMDSASSDLRGKVAFSIGFLPILVGTLLAYWMPSIITLSILYVTACFGSGWKNIITANLRNKRVPSEKISSVNTLFGTYISLGTLLGGLFVIPIVEKDIEQGLLVAIGFIGLSILLSALLLPKESIRELSAEEI